MTLIGKNDIFLQALEQNLKNYQSKFVPDQAYVWQVQVKQKLQIWSKNELKQPTGQLFYLFFYPPFPMPTKYFLGKAAQRRLASEIVNFPILSILVFIVFNNSFLNM